MNEKLGKNSLAFILVLGLFMRLLGIFSRPIWYDEALSLLYAQTSPSEIVYAMLGSGAQAANVHPPTFFITLWVWGALFGHSVVTARLLSVILGLLTIWVIYLLIDELFADTALASKGAFIVAISPFHIHYSHEIRMYSGMAFFLILGTFFYIKSVKTLKNRWWILFAISAALSQYMQSLAVFYLLVLASSALFTRQIQVIKKTLLAGLGALLLYLPWLVQLPSQLSKIQSAYWVERPGIEKVFTLLLVYVSNLPLPEILLPWALFVAVLVAFLATYQTVQAVRYSDKKNKFVLGAWLAYLAIAPALTMFLVSLWVPVFLERALLASGSMFLLWMVWAMYKTRLPAMVTRVVLLMLLSVFGMGIYQHVTYADFPYAPYKEIVETLKKEAGQGGIIIHSSKLSMLPTYYYDPQLPQVFIADLPGSQTDTLARETQQVLGVQSISELSVATADFDVVFLVIFQKSLDEAQKTGLSMHPHVAWMRENFIQEDGRAFGSIWVFKYLRHKAAR